MHCRHILRPALDHRNDLNMILEAIRYLFNLVLICITYFPNLHYVINLIFSLVHLKSFFLKGYLPQVNAILCFVRSG